MELIEKNSNELLIKLNWRWTRGNDGRETVDEETGCALRGGQKDKGKTETEMGGLREERFGGSGG